ncbi:MAG: coenzyme F390 synthetase [Pirellulaceae bacterium]|nr:MAG: coenzyme F390 synthetase [Pirellulaceae bacterium]
MSFSYEERRRLEQMARDELRHFQLDRFRRLLEIILPHNEFYSKKFHGISLPIRTWEEFCSLPFTTKDELCTRQDGLAANLTFPVERYVRLHRTSGSRGRPLTVLDTPEDWQWWLEGWQFVLDAAGLQAGHRVVLAFSFGPFIGFWSAYEACAARRALVVPTGGMSTAARLELIAQLQPQFVLSTPSYALRMAEVARERGWPLHSWGVEALIVAGEPGGSIPSTRARIEQAWGARVIDHAGATEVGPWGYADENRVGLYVNESQFIAEFRPLDQVHCLDDTQGRPAELVLTTLGRTGCPVIRYRTGDVVLPHRHHTGRTRFVLLEGGVLGRADDMVIVRGVNIFPSALEEVLRELAEVEEFRITVYRHQELDQLRIEVEDALHQPQRIADLIQRRIGIRVEVVDVPAGTLPRFEGKGRRFVDLRSAESRKPPPPADQLDSLGGS